jgi:hypothetical protein
MRIDPELVSHDAARIIDSDREYRVERYVEMRVASVLVRAARARHRPSE